jgi:hypothetical protein
MRRVPLDRSDLALTFATLDLLSLCDGRAFGVNV